MSGKKGQAAPRCFQCRAPLKATTVPTILVHPTTSCPVKLTELTGMSVDDQYELIADVIYERVSDPTMTPDPDVIWAFPQWKIVEEGLKEIFAEFAQPYLGGASGTSGWSSFALYQRCPYLWYRTHVEPLPAPIEGAEQLDGYGAEPFGRAVGAVVHVMLGVHYQRKIDPRYPITPEIVRARLAELECDPTVISEAWRLFAPYRLYYKHEQIQPLAIEHLEVDPATGESTRYDLVCRVLDGYEGRIPGVYICDHKTAQRFDHSTLFGWVNDGTIIQQVTLWKRNGLDEKFGPLQGVIVNIIGKQKTPELHRTWVSPNTWQVEQQTVDLRIWKGHRSLALATGVFPRSRANCISRYGMCDLFEHCATGEQ